MRTESIASLKAHPRQLEIYGDEPVDSELLKSIKENGILQPLIITPDGVILSGFRRCRAASKAGLKVVPVDVREGLDETEQLATLIESNRQRVKEPRQIAREAKALIEIEEARARLRSAANLKQGQLIPEREMLPTRGKQGKNEENGRARDRIGKHLGLSGRTVEKLIEVEKKIETLEETGRKEEAKQLEKTLNKKSINAAYQHVRPDTKPKPKPRPPRLPTIKEPAEDLSHITEEWIRAEQYRLYTVVMQRLLGCTEASARAALAKLIRDSSQSAAMAAMAIAGNNLNSIKSEKLEPYGYIKAIAKNLLSKATPTTGNGNGARRKLTDEELLDNHERFVEAMLSEQTTGH